MDKGRRNELAQLKKKKRMKIYSTFDASERWTNKLKSHGKFCSCDICTDPKYRDTRSTKKFKYKEDED